MQNVKLVPFLLSIITSVFITAVFATLYINHLDRLYQNSKQKAVDRKIEVIQQDRRIDSLKVIENSLKNEDILWLARAVFTETDRTSEMYYVAWVVRNRVEIGYNGKNTYRGVVLDPYQFSAFNPRNTERYKYINLDIEDLKNPVFGKRWFYALSISSNVYQANPIERPFPKYTLYFYSEVSMRGNSHPHWRDNFVKIPMNHLNEKRFRFFADFRYKGGTPETGPLHDNNKTSYSVTR